MTGVQTCALPIYTDIRTFGHTDHLLYQVAHAYKHLIYSGIGIRQICDIALFSENYGPYIDWKKVYDSCKEKHLDLFLEAILKICVNYLGMDEKKAGFLPVISLSELEEEPLLSDILSGGIYGAQDENRLHSANMTLSAVSSGKQGKQSRGLKNSLFPSFSYMSKKYPYLKKHKVLLPLAWAQRIVTYLSKQKKGNDPEKTIGIGKQRIELLKKYGLL